MKFAHESECALGCEFFDFDNCICSKSERCSEANFWGLTQIYLKEGTYEDVKQNGVATVRC